MFFRPFYRFDTGCAAYVFGCGGKGLACVVDPHEGDVDEYMRFAASKGMKITHVFDTHVHADHRSGARWLTQMTDAKYCLHRSANVTFKFTPLDDGQVIELGNTIIKVLHTPGHTPGSCCFQLDSLLFAGDTLFQRSIGRTDLPGGDYPTIERSIQSRLYTLDPDTKVICGHGPTTTIGDEARANPFVRAS